jgi:hypothetical protein
MGTTHRFLATVEESSAVLDWFRSLPEQPVEPLVNVFMPVRKRGVLTTIGEVHFLARPLSAFPALNQVNKRFRNWLRANPCVYSHRPDFVHEWDYFLEGSAREWDSDIFALPAGMAALQRGSYFVSADDNERRLDLVCRAMRLRGIEGVQ